MSQMLRDAVRSVANTRWAIRVCVIVITPAFCVWAQSSNWPKIQPVHESHTFVEQEPPGDTPFVSQIKDTSGALAYKLICHSGDYDDSADLNFSGTFQCYLFAVKGDALTSGNLLAADTKDERSTDW